jgi:hypothetical protein
MTRTFDGGRPRPRHRSSFVVAASAFAGLTAVGLVAAHPASADDKTWVGGNGNWDASAGWSPAGQPNGQDSVFVGSPAASDATLNYVNPANPLTNIYSDFQVNGNGTRLATLVQSQNTTLNTNRMIVGETGRGAVQLSGGAMNVLEAEGLTLGRQVGSSGAFALGGSAVLTVTGQVVVGETGEGAFTQTGGRLIVTGMPPQPGMPAPANGVLAVAGFTGSVGTFNLSGGSVEVGSLQLSPIGGSATFTHSGGSVAPTADLYVGDPGMAGLTGQAVYDHTGGGVTTPVLNIGSTGRFRHAGGSLRVNGLAIDPAGGRLDLTTQNMVLDYTGASPLAAVRNQVRTGYASGAWSGAGIVTTAGGRSAVAYAEASELLSLTGTNKATWNGQQVDATTLLLRHTLGGDATMDGTVDFGDLVRLAQSYEVVDGQRRWTAGDFTYDGNVDFADLVILAQNYDTALPAGPVPGAPAGFGGDLAAAFASVPEPGSLAAIAGAAGAALMRRRRRD